MRYTENLGYRQGRVGMNCMHTNCKEYVRGWTAGRLEWRTREWAFQRKLDRMAETD